MTIRQLRVFVEVCQEGSITKAADKLFLAQSNVSQIIKEMEQNLGIELFERRSRKLFLTAQGEQALDYARRILLLHDEMEVSCLSSKTEPMVRVGTGTALGKLYFPRFLSQFQIIHPEVRTLIKVDRVDLNAHALTTNALDFVIMESIPETKDILHSVLQISPIVAICHKDLPIAKKSFVTATDLSHVPLLLREKDSPTNKAVTEFFYRQNIQISPVWESISIMALINAAREKLGVSFVSKNQVEACKDDTLKILNIPGFDSTRQISVYYHKDKRFSPIMMEFISGFKEFINHS